MNRRAFSLIELLIVVVIIAILVGTALPYYEDYVRQTKLAKARHELDVIREALIKHDTFADRPFQSKDMRALLGIYLQDLPRDPWGRDYEIDYMKGQVWSLGPDYRDDRDNIIADYKPPLALQKATWVDRDGSRQISAGDLVRLEFSKYLQSGQGPLLYTNASPPTAGSDLWFSPDVSVLYFLATTTMASKTEVLIELAANASSTTFFPGSSTVRISPTNTKIKDFAGRNANGSDGEYPCLEVIIKAN